MGSPVKKQVENGISKLFDFWDQTIDVSDQSVFNLKDSGIHDEEGKKTNVSNPLTVGQRRSSSFLSFLIMVHPYQADPNCKNIQMNCRDCVQLLLYVDVIDAIINTQMLTAPHNLLVHLAALDNERKPEIGTLKKEKGDIPSEVCK